jgi:hypothetical protein
MTSQRPIHHQEGTDKGIPRYVDSGESDVFVLSGAEVLWGLAIVVGGETYDDAAVATIAVAAIGTVVATVGATVRHLQNARNRSSRQAAKVRDAQLAALDATHGDVGELAQ